MPQQKRPAAVRRNHLSRPVCRKHGPQLLRKPVGPFRGVNLCKRAVLTLKIDARRRAHQRRSIAARIHALDRAPFQSLRRAEFLEARTVVTVKTSLRAHPQIASAVLRNAVHIQVVHVGGKGAEGVVLGRAETGCKGQSGRAAQQLVYKSSDRTRFALQGRPFKSG